MSLYLASKYPIYSPEVKNYQDGVAYEVEMEKKGDGQYLVTQKVKGKSSFLYQVLKDRKAQFCIAYKIKESLTRRTHKYSLTEVSEQEIKGEYLIDDISKGLSFTLLPSIFLLEETELRVSPNNTYGLDELWCEGSPILFPKYSKIAHSTPLDSSDTDSNSLFRVKLNDSLGKGQLKVEFEAHYEEPFYIHCASDVFRFLDNSSDDNLKRAIESQILVGSFAQLRSYCQEKGEDVSSEKLSLLKEHMKEENLADWTADDFNPSEAATKLLPFKIPE